MWCLSDTDQRNIRINNAIINTGITGNMIRHFHNHTARCLYKNNMRPVTSVSCISEAIQLTVSIILRIQNEYKNVNRVVRTMYIPNSAITELVLLFFISIIFCVIFHKYFKFFFRCFLDFCMLTRIAVNNIAMAV